MPDAYSAQKNEFLIKPVKRRRLYANLKLIFPDEDENPPLNSPVLSTANDASPSVVDRSRLKILVCEDNPINVKVAKHLLKRLGCVPDIAEDGQCGVQACQEKQYDLILY